MKANRWNVPKKEEMTEVKCWFAAIGLTIFLASFIVCWSMILWSLLS